LFHHIVVVAIGFVACISPYIVFHIPNLHSRKVFDV
jgi:hypothetical protein